MENKILSFRELDTISRNINMIEGILGYEVPQYLIKADISSHILSLKEADTIARNIDMIDMMHNSRYSGGHANRYNDAVFTYNMVVTVLIIATIIIVPIIGMIFQ